MVSLGGSCRHEGSRGPSGLARKAAAILLLLGGFSGCDRDARVRIVQIARTQPSAQVEAGTEVGFAATVENSRNLDLIYRWSAVKGRLRTADAGASATYRAPDTPGIDFITIEALSANRVVASKATSVEIVEKVHDDVPTDSATADAQECRKARLTKPPGDSIRDHAGKDTVARRFQIEWSPPYCKMDVQAYQLDKLVMHTPGVRSPVWVKLSRSGETEIKIWFGGDSHSRWVWLR